MTVDVVGHGMLTIAIVASAAGALAAFTGRDAAARIALRTAAVALVVALLALARAIVRLDYSLSYVADVASRSLAGPYRLAGLWAGMEGSLLLWATVVAVVAIAAGSTRRGARKGDRTIATGVLAVLVASLAAASRITADPFRTLAIPAIDGAGITPILEHPAMLVHPPLLYIGLATTAPLFAITIAALVRNELDDAWLSSARRLALVGWTTCTVAITIGAAWAYVELGWGGFWAWDPIENGVLLPWLVLVAFVHAAQRARRSGAEPGRGDAALALAAFLVALMGAALTRSGAASSVHAFAQTTGVGRALSAIGLASLGLAGVALTSAKPRSTAPGAVDELDRMLLAQHAVILVIAAIVAIGTIGPVVGTWFGGRKRAISGHYFAALTAPAALAIAILLLASKPWTRSRSGASRIAHLGLLVLLAGFAVGGWSTDAVALLAPGGTSSIAGHRLVVTAPEVRSTERFQRLIVPVRLTIDGHVVTMRPELDVYETQGVALAETALHSGWRRDIQVAVRQVTPEGDVRVEAHDRPGIRLVWLGALLLAIGGIVAIASRRPRRDASPGRAHEAYGPVTVDRQEPSAQM